MVGLNHLLRESSFSRIHSHTKNRNIGMISASRGHLSPAENKERHSQLKDDIRKAGYGAIKVKGRYIENHGTPQAKSVDEHSYLVVGKKGHDGGQLLGHLKHLGQKYDQDSVLHKAHDSHEAHLHGTNDTGYPGKDKSVSVGTWHANRAGEFHSVMRGRKTFAFGEHYLLEPGFTWDYVTDVGFFSREEHIF